MKNYTYTELLNELNTGSPKDFWILFEGYLYDITPYEWDVIEEAIELYMEMLPDEFNECLDDLYATNQDDRILAFKNCVWNRF